MDMRIGHGFDAHRLAGGRPLILGGVRVPFAQGLLGHSDADVLSHAVGDALLGALALGDLGKHFPDTDPAFAGADSLKLLARIFDLVRARGWAVRNVDAVIMTQAPKLAPHAQAMAANIAAALQVPPGDVSVKATTTEGMGFTGRQEGIAASAVVLLFKNGRESQK
jgi:2-C-methyl-D-erythritol 2,4-cyclodiphosphate synthase